MGITSTSLRWDNDKILETMKNMGKQGFAKLSNYDIQFGDFELTVSRLIDGFCESKSIDLKLLSTFETQFRDILELDLNVLCAKAYNQSHYNTVLKIVMSYIVKYIAGLKFTTSVEMKKITGRRLSVNFRTVKLDDLLGIELIDSGVEIGSDNDYVVIRAFIVKQVEYARQQLIVIVVIAIGYLTYTSGFIPDPSYTITRNKQNLRKNKYILINVGSHKERKDQWISCQTGLQYGFDEVRARSISELDSDFVTLNIETLAYGSWKPYIILTALKSCSEDDIIFYADSNTYFRKNIDLLLDYMNKPEHYDMLLFDDRNHHKEYKYTKRDVFIGLDYDNDESSNSVQRLSSYSAWRNTKRTRTFVNEWLQYCQYKQLISNSLNTRGIPNHIKFKKNSGERSILSVLSKKYGIKSLPFRTVKNFIVSRSIMNRV